MNIKNIKIATWSTSEKENIYPSGNLIKFTSDSPMDNRSNFSKTKCELLDYE